MVKFHSVFISIFCLTAAVPGLAFDFAKTEDGKKVRGHLESVPPLSYHFGRVEFTPEEVAEIEIDAGQNKAKYRTENHLAFIGKLDQNGRRHISGQFGFDKPDTIVKVELNEPSKNLYYPKNVWTIEFKNGNRLPVQFTDKVIPLKGGLLTTGTIEDLSVDRGISGTVKINGKKQEIEHAEPKNSHVRVKIATKNSTYRFPWASIARITRPVPDEEDPEKLYRLGVHGKREEGRENTALLGVTMPEKPKEREEEKDRIAEVVHPPKPSLPNRGCAGCRVINR